MKNIIVTLFLFILALQFISSDMVVPGQKDIPIENLISNIADFPDYTFVRVCGFRLENETIKEINSYEIINSDGKIKPYYNKPCNENSVYAFKKADLPLIPLTEEALLKYINIGKGIKVLSDIETTEYSTIGDSRELITRQYTISLNSTTINPDNTKVERNFLIYLYYIIPLVAIGIVSYIIIKRRKVE